MKVLVVLGSESDRPIANKCVAVLDSFGIQKETRVASAHRTPEKLKKIVKESDADVFITIAGLAAALPGVVASHTTKPVIGVPVDVKLGGLDALLSIAQMPPGVPVATVGIDRGDNAALLAIEILALKYPELKEKLKNYREKMRKKVNR